jgi:hypothetical protein
MVRASTISVVDVRRLAAVAASALPAVLTEVFRLPGNSGSPKWVIRGEALAVSRQRDVQGALVASPARCQAPGSLLEGCARPMGHRYPHPWGAQIRCRCKSRLFDAATEFMHPTGSIPSARWSDGLEPSTPILTMNVRRGSIHAGARVMVRASEPRQ